MPETIPMNKIEDYSAPLEWVKKEEKNIKDAEERMLQRIEFLKAEDAKLEAMQDDQENFSEEKINKQLEIADNAHADIKRLEKEITESKNKIREFKATHKIFTNALEDFEPEIEH